jgi:hypothetical protein
MHLEVLLDPIDRFDPHHVNDAATIIQMRGSREGGSTSMQRKAAQDT